MNKIHESKTRVSIQYSGEAARRIMEATDLLGFSTDGDTVRYLAQRGLDQISQQVQTRRFLRDLESKLDPQEMLQLLTEKEIK